MTETYKNPYKDINGFLNFRDNLGYLIYVMEVNMEMKVLGFSTLDLLQMLFIVLKIIGKTTVATWSWPIVLIPLWIELGIVAIMLLFVLIVAIANRD